MLPSSNYMRARRKLVCRSHPGEKEKCQLSRKWLSSPPPGDFRRLITRYSSPLTAFLIANSRLEFGITGRRVNRLQISNRKFFAIFTPGNPAPLAFIHTLDLPMQQQVANRRPPLFEGLRGTVAKSEFESSSTSQAAKRFSSSYKIAVFKFDAHNDSLKFHRANSHSTDSIHV